MTGVKSTTRFLTIFLTILAMCMPKTLAVSEEQYLFFTGDGTNPYVDSLYVRDNGEDRVTYCYNYFKKLPPTRHEGGQAVNKIEKATAEQFYQMTSENVRTMDPEAFHKAILSICYQGYPYNGTGLMETYGLSPAALRGITQLAVWYYTDSIDISQHISDFQLFEDYPSAWPAYLKLTTPLDTLPRGYQLDLYQNPNEEYQNALCTRLTETPMKKTSVLLKGTKRLEGRDLLAGEFHFTVTDEQNREASRGINRADGSIAFNYIEYTHDDVGLHRYTVREVRGDLPNVAYDGAAYSVDVLVEYASDQLTAAVQGEPQLVFRNVYGSSPAPTPEPGLPPATGDKSRPEVWALAALAALAVAGALVAFGRRRSRG